ncbi:hypothetical protein NQ176_g4658 [Zarea fungicola]|uniref:Uncharacterized protein n=1 Tax=Zarea fungicola TaxID=93591 RepID=A0ACC1NC93_9HYPO|nr:hypothetical protein NQ176_g4658 [Lecanicillium fungicola]
MVNITDKIKEIEDEMKRTQKNKATGSSIVRSDTPRELYDALKPLCQSVDIWHTHYQHVLDSHQDVVEWVKGTGLRPFIDPLEPDQREAFLAAYLEQIKQRYPKNADASYQLEQKLMGARIL